MNDKLRPLSPSFSRKITQLTNELLADSNLHCFLILLSLHASLNSVAIKLIFDLRVFFFLRILIFFLLYLLCYITRASFFRHCAFIFLSFNYINNVLLCLLLNILVFDFQFLVLWFFLLPLHLFCAVLVSFLLLLLIFHSHHFVSGALSQLSVFCDFKDTNALLPLLSTFSVSTSAFHSEQSAQWHQFR